MSSRKNTSRKNYRLQWGSKYVFKRSDKLSQASLILTTLAPCALASFENKKSRFLPRKKNKLQKSGFSEHTKKNRTIFVPKKFWGTSKKKTPRNLQQPSPKTQDLPKNLNTEVLSNPNICFPTTPFVPNFRRRSAIFLRRSAKGSSSPAWKKVVLASKNLGNWNLKVGLLEQVRKNCRKIEEKVQVFLYKGNNPKMIHHDTKK